jgi:hypothetical protein
MSTAAYTGKHDTTNRGKDGRKDDGRRHLRFRAGFRIILFLWAFIAVLNIVAWSSTGFCDWYQANVFPLWVNTLGRLNGLASFSVGEVMITIGVIWIAAGLVILAFTLVIFAGRRIRREAVPGSGFLRFAACFGRATAVIVTYAMLVMTLNCFVVYHATGLPAPELTESEQQTRYSTEALGDLRDFIVSEANMYAVIVDRDDDGEVVIGEEPKQEAVDCMLSLSESSDEYSCLKGYYPEPKGMYYSHLMSQSYMQGYYFPFSMEANYNTDMTVMRVPFTLCHELGHLKGYMKEDDCNMLGFLACLESDDPAFVYSGYLGVLAYVNNAWYKAIGYDTQEYLSHPLVSEQVSFDDEFLREDIWDEVEENAVVDTETVHKTNVVLSDASMKANGIRAGRDSYDLVVSQLLDWWAETGSKLN